MSESPFDLEDMLCAIGIALASAGIAFIFWPAALIFAGTALAALGLLRSRP